jgi:uncharacterized protein (TIGR04255 family)
MPNTLPDFDRPPLDEVAIGVQFEPLKGFHAGHLGLFWSRVRGRYPFTEDQPPIVPQVEPAEVAPGSGPQVTFGTFPMIARSWFLDEGKNQLLQLQGDRFHRNWRQIEGTEPYPRYEYLIREFRREWDEFLAFLNDEKIETPAVTQCEITYINNLPPGAGWQNFSDLATVFTTLRAPKESGFLPAPELFAWDARYKLPEGRGRLRVKMQPGFRNRDLQLILVLDLTARGAPAANTQEGIFAWFDTAHEWIVRAFDELTEAEMHKTWGKKS